MSNRKRNPRSHKTGKEFLGPGLWATIHYFAAAYTPDKAREYKTFIYTLPTLMDCELCKDHLKKNLEKLPIDRYLKSRDTLFLWTYILHDIVNQSKNVRSPSFEKVREYYYSIVIGGKECKDCKI